MMSHEDAQSFDLSADVGALSPESTTDTTTTPPEPGTVEPFTVPPDPGTVSPDQEYAELQQEVQAEELELQQEMQSGPDPAAAPAIDPSVHDPAHPDPSSVPPDAPTDDHYDHDGNLVEGVAPTSHVIGDPNADASQWSFQGANGYCGPNSLSMLMESATGHQFTEGDVADWAIQNNEMTHLPPSEDSPAGTPSLHYGMLPQQAADTINALGEQYGIEATLQQGDMSDLESALSSGHEVMIEIDDEKIWHEQGVPDSDQANHFVVVTGFDPSTDTVFLNDPGTPDGREESVPLSDFKAAWKASDNAMITVNSSPDDGGPGSLPDGGSGEHGDTTDYHDMSSWSGPILLPVVMSRS
jgi:hypothetical protein